MTIQISNAKILYKKDMQCKLNLIRECATKDGDKIPKGAYDVLGMLKKPDRIKIKAGSEIVDISAECFAIEEM